MMQYNSSAGTINIIDLKTFATKLLVILSTVETPMVEAPMYVLENEWQELVCKHAVNELKTIFNSKREVQIIQGDLTPEHLEEVVRRFSYNSGNTLDFIIIMDQEIVVTSGDFRVFLSIAEDLKLAVADLRPSQWEKIKFTGSVKFLIPEVTHEV